MQIRDSAPHVTRPPLRSGRKQSDARCILRILLTQVCGTATFKVRIIEPRRHRGAHQGELGAGEQVTSLPDSGRHHHLRPLAGCQIAAQENDVGSSVRPKMEYLDGAAKIMMENLVRGEGDAELKTSRE